MCIFLKHGDDAECGFMGRIANNFSYRAVGILRLHGGEAVEAV
jgi:hypothetical protein